MRGWIVGLLALVVGIVVVGVVAIAAFAGADRNTPIVELEVGDCFELPDETNGTIDGVDTVDCSAPHLAEVVHVGTLNDGDDVVSEYPPDDELFALVDRSCRNAGVVVSEAFGLLPIAPTVKVWESFDGRYVCVAVPFGGEPVTGSARTG